MPPWNYVGWTVTYLKHRLSAWKYNPQNSIGVITYLIAQQYLTVDEDTGINICVLNWFLDMYFLWFLIRICIYVYICININIYTQSIARFCWISLGILKRVVWLAKMHSNIQYPKKLRKQLCLILKCTLCWLMAKHRRMQEDLRGQRCRTRNNYATSRHYLHDDVIKWKHFPRYWPFVRGIHRSPVNSPHKGQWRGDLMFSLICVWINGWVNNRETDDLRHYRGHNDVTVISDWHVTFTGR